MEKNLNEDIETAGDCEAQEVVSEAEETQEAVSEDAEASEEAEADKKKGGFFKKKDKKKDPKDEKIEELTDRIMRNMAEFDNYRKRTDKEKSQMFLTGASSVVEKLLPVVDDFERGLAAMSEEDKATSFSLEQAIKTDVTARIFAIVNIIFFIVFFFFVYILGL